MTVQCDCVIEARKPDIVVEKESNKAIIIIIVDIASLWNHRVYEKDGEKIDNYQDLKRVRVRVRVRLGTMGIRQQEVIQVVVGTLGAVNKRLDTWLDKLGITIRTGFLQKRPLMGAARTLRKVLER